MFNSLLNCESIDTNRSNGEQSDIGKTMGWSQTVMIVCRLNLIITLFDSSKFISCYFIIIFEMYKLDKNCNEPRVLQITAKIIL